METLIIAMCLVVLIPVYVGLFSFFFPKERGRSSDSHLERGAVHYPRGGGRWRMALGLCFCLLTQVVV